MEWYYILGIVSYGIFLLQFCLSFIGGDIDVDFDREADFSFSDLISFKGLIHFLMGFSGWLMTTQRVTPFNIVVACIIGFALVLILYYVYKLALNLQSIPTRKCGIELIGSTVTIYITMEDISENYCICTICNGGITEEISCVAPVKVGDKRIILNYKNGIYLIF